MTKSKQPSIDGFIPRRPTNGPLQQTTTNPDDSIRLQSTDSGLTRGTEESEGAPLLSTESSHGLTRESLDATLNSIDENSEGQDKKHKRKHPVNKKKLIKRAILAVLLVGVLAGGYMGAKIIMAAGNVFQGNILGLIKEDPLKQDANGQTNILILGTSEDDPNHQAAYLTDSMMVVSVNQEKKTAIMFSIPRDLEVEYGMACISGYAGKVNAFFNCVNEEDSEAAEEERQTKTRELIGGVVGLDIQYSVHVNYTVLRDLVSAVDGITLTIESEDPRGIMDGNFDWKCGVTVATSYRSPAQKAACPPNGHFIDYPNGEVTLDAEHALYLAQARGEGTQPTYGLPNSNFDREKNQQKIVLAIRQKALSTGTLTDITKVSKLIDALGSNLRSNFETSEIRTALKIASEVQESSIQRLDLLGDKVLNESGQPSAGTYNYTELQSYIQKSLSSDPVVREGASLAVYNGSDTVGLAGTVTTELEAKGFTVVETANAIENFDGTYDIYDITKTKAATKQKLAEMYGVTVKTTDPPFAVEGVDFVIIAGTRARTQATE